MFVDKSQVSMAIVHFTQERRQQHRLWLESSHKRGQQISLENQNLCEARLSGSELGQPHKNY
jgi:hypothetical protein